MKNTWLVVIEKNYPDFFHRDIESFDSKEAALECAKGICTPPNLSRQGRGRYQCNVTVYFADEISSDGYCIDKE